MQKNKKIFTISLDVLEQFVNNRPVYENGTVSNALIGKPLNFHKHYYFENKEQKGGHNIVFKNHGRPVYFRMREFLINDIIDKNNVKYTMYQYITKLCGKTDKDQIDFSLLPPMAIKTIENEKFYNYAIPNYKHITFKEI